MSLESLIAPRSRDLGNGFVVRRALPYPDRQTVGPFIFFDQMGPAELGAGKGLDVRPHPHIGLSTVTYLFEGAILHRDSLGTVQRIEPGAVNWMTAGRGIVHSERSPDDERGRVSRLSGIQIWVALPKAREEDPPSFVHLPEAELPRVEEPGWSLRVMAGALSGLRAPTPILSELFYADLKLDAGATFTLQAEHAERGAYLTTGRVSLPDGTALEVGTMPIFKAGQDIVLRAETPSRLLLFGGEPLDGPRHIVWNFVSSSAKRLAQAKEDWKAGRFPQVPQEHEWIPLPDDLPIPVDYP